VYYKNFPWGCWEKLNKLSGAIILCPPSPPPPPQQICLRGEERRVLLFLQSSNINLLFPPLSPLLFLSPRGPLYLKLKNSSIPLKRTPSTNFKNRKKKITED